MPHGLPEAQMGHGVVQGGLSAAAERRCGHIRGSGRGLESATGAPQSPRLRSGNHFQNRLYWDRPRTPLLGGGKCIEHQEGSRRHQFAAALSRTTRYVRRMRNVAARPDVLRLFSPQLRSSHSARDHTAPHLGIAHPLPLRVCSTPGGGWTGTPKGNSRGSSKRRALGAETQNRSSGMAAA